MQDEADIRGLIKSLSGNKLVNQMVNVNLKREIPFSKLGQSLQEPVITDLMRVALQRPELITLAAGFTDNAKLPKELVHKAIDELGSIDDLPTYLQYGTNQGRPELRRLTAEHLKSYPNEKPDCYVPENIMIANGSQQILYMATQVLCDPGDIVLVEGPSYFVFLELLKGLGVEGVSMPMLEDGCIDFDGLSAWLEKAKATGDIRRVKAIYIDSYYANPTGHCVPVSDKVKLGNLLREKDLYLQIIEDAAYRDVSYGDPCEYQSIMSIPELEEFPKLYLGTYTKPFSSGFKIGYGCCSSKEWLEKMLYVKGHQDFGSANFTQAILEVVLKNGWYQEWLKGLRSHYGEKVDCFERIAEAEGLRNMGWSWMRPEGGLMIWLKGPEGLDTSMGSEFYERCLENGVFYVPGNLCYAEGVPKNHVRLSVGTLDKETLEEGLRRFIKALKA